MRLALKFFGRKRIPAIFAFRLRAGNAEAPASAGHPFRLGGGFTSGSGAVPEAAARQSSCQERPYRTARGPVKQNAPVWRVRGVLGWGSTQWRSSKLWRGFD